MVKLSREEGYWVRGVDLKRPEFSSSRENAEFVQGIFEILILFGE